MKSKFRLCSLLAAFACVLASGFARGEGATVINSNTGKPYDDLQEAINDAEPDAQLVLWKSISDATATFSVTKSVSLYLNSRSVNVKSFDVKENGALIIQDGNTTTNFSMSGQFVITGGSLQLLGGVYRTNGNNPLIKTEPMSGATNRVVVKNASIQPGNVNCDVAIWLEGENTVQIDENSKIERSSNYPYDKQFSYGLFVTNGISRRITIRSASISAISAAIRCTSATTARLIGAILRGDDCAIELCEGCEFVVSSETSLTGGFAALRTDYAKVSIVNSTLVGGMYAAFLTTNGTSSCRFTASGAKTVLNGGTDLFGQGIMAPSNEWGAWEDNIHLYGGTYSRHLRSEFETMVTNKWVNGARYVVTWPTDTKFTVGNKATVTYHLKVGEYCPDSPAETNVNYDVTRGPVKVETPEQLKIDNDKGVFDGWYPTTTAAQSGVGEVMTVTCTTNLYARWLKKVEVEYKSDFGSLKTNVVYGVEKSGQDISRVTPESFGITNNAAIFVGWYDASDVMVTNVVASTNLVAKWDACLMTFNSGYDSDPESVTTSLVQWVVNGSVDLAKNEIDAAMFGWEREDKVFVGWSYRKDGLGNLVESIQIPPAQTNLWAMWTDPTQVAYVNGETYPSISEAIEHANGTNNVIMLLADIVDEPKIDLTTHSALINLNGKTIGNASNEVGITILGANELRFVELSCKTGTVYGTIYVGDNARVRLEGGTYVSLTNEVVCAEGTNYVFEANGVTFRGNASDDAYDVLSFASPDSSGYAVLTNSVVGSQRGSGTVNCGVLLAGGELWISDTEISALQYGVDILSDVDITNVCSIVDESSISAFHGIRSGYADVWIKDSEIRAVSTGTKTDSYAIELCDGGDMIPRLVLEGENLITGGSVVYGSKVNGGLMSYDDVWKTNIIIIGGTYAHQVPTNLVVDAGWVNTNKCNLEWIDLTTFKVTDRAFTFKMRYEDWPDVVTNMFSDVAWTNEVAVTGETNHVGYVTITNITPWSLLGEQKPTNTTFTGWSLDGSSKVTVEKVVYGQPLTLYAVWTNAYTITYVTNYYPEMLKDGTPAFRNSNKTSYLDTDAFSFVPATAHINGGHYTTVGWKYGNDYVVSISNATLLAANGVAVAKNPGNITLVAQWDVTNWEEDPAGSITLATGVIDPEMETEADWNGEDEEGRIVWPTISEGMEEVTYYEGDEDAKLPTADDVKWTDSTGKAHTFSGWTVWYRDWENDRVVTGELYSTSITIEEIKKIEATAEEKEWDWEQTLHAVWDQGGKTKGLDNFEDLYNDDRDARLPGGDTYVGVILDGEQTMGTITVKCGVPDGQGLVPITATVKTAEGGTVTFRGKGAYKGDTITVDLEKGDHTLSLTLDSKSIQSGSYDNYDIQGGVNKFKGSQEDKDEGDLRLKHWLGKWMIIFATESAQDESYKKKVHGEWEVQDTGKENGSAHAYGYSYVVLDIKDKGLVSVSGKLANGKEVSSTATAIVGDNGVCVPVVCSIYSGYDWFALCNFARNYGMCALVPTVTDNFRTTSRGGFGFTAWFSNSGTNLLELASENDSLIVNNVSEWDTSYDKSMPFTATVVATNAQKVADIKLPEKMVFYVDKDTDFGWLLNANDENIGDLTEGVYYIPSQTYDVPDNGYLQTVTATASTNGAYSIKADGKASKMKLVDADGMPYIVPGKNGSNFSALKLKYKQKNGVFTGSFKIYSLKTNQDGDKTSLKKTKVTVSGGIADGRGYGFSHSKAVGSQPVMLVPVGDATLSEPKDNGADSEEDDDFEEDWDEVK